MRSRTQIENSFRKLGDNARKNILAQWGFAAWDDIPDDMLPGVASDIAAASGTITAKAEGKQSTAERINNLAGETYNKINAAPAEVAEVEINPRAPIKTDQGVGIFGDQTVDDAAIFEKYNRLNDRTINARRAGCKPDAEA